MGERLDFSFATLGGRQAACLLGCATPKAVVVVAPALGIRASYYAKLCSGLAARGLAAVAIDLPGHGASPVRAGPRDWGYADLIEHYASACAALERLRDAPLLLLGHSIGGQVALMLGGRAPTRLRAVVLVASGAPYWRCWPGLEGARIRLATAASAQIARMLGHYPGERLGFGGREARRLIREWASVARTGDYAFADLDGETLLASEGPPVHAIALAGDGLAPEAAIRHMLGKLRRRSVSFETWTGAPHAGSHNRWPSAPEFVVERVVEMVEGLR